VGVQVLKRVYDSCRCRVSNQRLPLTDISGLTFWPAVEAAGLAAAYQCPEGGPCDESGGGERVGDPLPRANQDASCWQHGGGEECELSGLTPRV